MKEDILDALAVHRLTKLVIDDTITEDLREWVWEKYGQPDESKVGYLFTCPWCVSIWMGIGVTAARTMAPKTWRAASYVLAFSSVTGWIEEHS